METFNKQRVHSKSATNLVSLYATVQPVLIASQEASKNQKMIHVNKLTKLFRSSIVKRLIISIHKLNKEFILNFFLF